jgi:hypothetical protein
MQSRKERGERDEVMAKKKLFILFPPSSIQHPPPSMNHVYVFE